MSAIKNILLMVSLLASSAAWADNAIKGPVSVGLGFGIVGLASDPTMEYKHTSSTPANNKSNSFAFQNDGLGTLTNLSLGYTFNGGFGIFAELQANDLYMKSAINAANSLAFFDVDLFSGLVGFEYRGVAADCQSFGASSNGTTSGIYVSGSLGLARASFMEMQAIGYNATTNKTQWIADATFSPRNVWTGQVKGGIELLIDGAFSVTASGGLIWVGAIGEIKQKEVYGVNNVAAGETITDVSVTIPRMLTGFGELKASYFFC